MIYGKYFNAIKSPTEIEANFIPCNHIKKFTIDTLLYLHIYTGLYLSIMKYNDTNNNNIEILDELVKNLKIKIDTITPTPTNMFDFNTNEENKTFTFYLQNFIVNYKSEINAGYKNYDEYNKHKPILTNVNTFTGDSNLNIGINNDDTGIVYEGATPTKIGTFTFQKNNSTEYSKTIVSNNQNNRLNTLKQIIYDILNIKTENIQGYLKYYYCYYQMILYNISIQVSIRTFYLNAVPSPPSSPYPIRTQIGAGAIVKNSELVLTYKTKFTGVITSGGGGFQIGDIIELNNNNPNIPIRAKCVVRSVGNYGVITAITVDKDYLDDGCGYEANISKPYSYIYKRKDGSTFVPILAPILEILPPVQVLYIPMSNYGSGYYLNPTPTLNNITINSGSLYIYFKDTNTYGIKYMIIQPYTGGTIVLESNPSITLTSKETSFNLDTYNNVSNIDNGDKITKILQAINNNIYNMLNNINNLSINSNKYNYLKQQDESSDEYTVQKIRYIGKIKLLNKVKQEYSDYQTDVNYKVRIYNENLKKFKQIKNYANYIIYFLILLIILTLVLSIVSFLSSNVKFTYYVISIIVLSILIALYYNNFKNTHLNEKFTDYSSNIINPTSNSCNTSIITYNSQKNSDREVHAFIINRLGITLNNYYNIINTFNDKYRTYIISFGTDVFTRNNDEILYNIYLTSVKEIDLYKIKKIELANSIEIIKRQIIYLFNLILFISLFTIILILGLLLYSIVPSMMASVISLCIILLIIVITYFGFVLSYPTRLIADKNYWAVHNPSKSVLAKIS